MTSSLLISASFIQKILLAGTNLRAKIAPDRPSPTTLRTTLPGFPERQSLPKSQIQTVTRRLPKPPESAPPACAYPLSAAGRDHSPPALPRSAPSPAARVSPSLHLSFRSGLGLRPSFTPALPPEAEAAITQIVATIHRPRTVPQVPNSKQPTRLRAQNESVNSISTPSIDPSHRAGQGVLRILVCPISYRLRTETVSTRHNFHCALSRKLSRPLHDFSPTPFRNPPRSGSLWNRLEPILPRFPKQSTLAPLNFSPDFRPRPTQKFPEHSPGSQTIIQRLHHAFSKIRQHLSPVKSSTFLPHAPKTTLPSHPPLRKLSVHGSEKSPFPSSIMAPFTKIVPVNRPPLPPLIGFNMTADTCKFELQSTKKSNSKAKSCSNIFGSLRYCTGST